MTRAEYRRIAAAAATEAVRPVVTGTEGVVEAPRGYIAASIAEQVVAETVASTLPLRRRSRARRTDASDRTVPVVVSEAPPAAMTASPLAEPESPAPSVLDDAFTLVTSDRTAATSGPPAVDEFEAAARLFLFTGETPVQTARAAAEAPSAPTVRARATAASKPRRGRHILKRVAAASFSVSVVGIVGALAVVTTTPASAVSAFGPAASADISILAPQKASPTEEIQAYVAASDVKSSDLVRAGEYDIESMADVAADSGVTQFAGTWVNDTAADVQWPFPVGVPISAAYGSGSYLSKFATPHRGVDLTPGRGAEIHAIASGTVRIATEGGGDYGVTVVIDHIIDGELVSTRYGHMEYGSLRVSPGESIEVGDVIGTVGSTGKATGPHLHFEVLLGGTQRVDPMVWLYEHTAD